MTESEHRSLNNSQNKCQLLLFRWGVPHGKVHGANMRPNWGRQDPGGPHVGPMNFVICDVMAIVNELSKIGCVIAGLHCIIIVAAGIIHNTIHKTLFLCIGGKYHPAMACLALIFSCWKAETLMTSGLPLAILGIQWDVIRCAMWIWLRTLLVSCKMIAWINNYNHCFLLDVIAHICFKITVSLVKLSRRLHHGWLITSHGLCRCNYLSISYVTYFGIIKQCVKWRLLQGVDSTQ